MCHSCPSSLQFKWHGVYIPGFLCIHLFYGVCVYTCVLQCLIYSVWCLMCRSLSWRKKENPLFKVLDWYSDSISSSTTDFLHDLRQIIQSLYASVPHPICKSQVAILPLQPFASLVYVDCKLFRAGTVTWAVSPNGQSSGRQRLGILPKVRAGVRRLRASQQTGPSLRLAGESISFHGHFLKQLLGSNLRTWTNQGSWGKRPVWPSEMYFLWCSSPQGLYDKAHDPITAAG